MDAPTSLAGGNLWERIRAWVAAHPKAALTLAVLAALGPLLAKPFNMDDPLFIWTARQIQASTRAILTALTFIGTGRRRQCGV